MGSPSESQLLLLQLFATAVTNMDGSDYLAGIHSGIAIALAVVTDGIEDTVTAINPNYLIQRGHDIFHQEYDQALVTYLEEMFAMDAVEG